jgi:hypothetical protein
MATAGKDVGVENVSRSFPLRVATNLYHTVAWCWVYTSLEDGVYTSLSVMYDTERRSAADSSPLSGPDANRVVADTDPVVPDNVLRCA